MGLSRSLPRGGDGQQGPGASAPPRRPAWAVAAQPRSRAEGLGAAYLLDYGAFRASFEHPAHADLEVVEGYLDSDSIEPVPFERMAQQFPEGMDRVMARLTGQGTSDGVEALTEGAVGVLANGCGGLNRPQAPGIGRGGLQRRTRAPGIDSGELQSQPWAPGIDSGGLRSQTQAPGIEQGGRRSQTRAPGLDPGGLSGQTRAPGFGTRALQTPTWAAGSARGGL